MEQDFNSLLEQYGYVIKRVINRYNLSRVSHCYAMFDYEYIFHLGTIGLWKASKNFDELNGMAFESYAFITIRREIVDEIRSMTKCRTDFHNNHSFVDIDLIDPRVWKEQVDFVKELENKEYVEHLFKILQSQDRKILREVFYGGKKQREIAEMVNQSESNISLRLKGALRLLKGSVNTPLSF